MRIKTSGYALMARKGKRYGIAHSGNVPIILGTKTEGAYAKRKYEEYQKKSKISGYKFSVKKIH